MKLCLVLASIAIAASTVMPGPSYAQPNYLPCINFPCPEGYQAVQQYDNSCLCISTTEPPKCDSTFCGPGYKPVLQSNGSCMCMVLDCTREDGCPKPPEAAEDCASIEGCNPPQIIKP